VIKSTPFQDRLHTPVSRWIYLILFAFPLAAYERTDTVTQMYEQVAYKYSTTTGTDQIKCLEYCLW